jgi:hypothetical protein
MRTKVSESTPLNGNKSSTTPTAIARIAETSGHQKITIHVEPEAKAKLSGVPVL